MTDRSQPTRFLAFDIVHAVEFSRIGRACSFSISGGLQGNCPNLPSPWPMFKPDPTARARLRGCRRTLERVSILSLGLAIYKRF